VEYTDNSATRRTGTLLAMTGGILAGVGGASASGRIGDGETMGLAILGLVDSGVATTAGTVMMLTDTAVLRMDGEGERDGERWSARNRRPTARAASAFGPF
jgi:hypothetical protein